MRRSAWVVASLLIVVPAWSVIAQNLAANGEFGTDILGWTPLDSNLSAQWSPSDHAGNPGSGSLLAINSAPVAASLAVVSCVDTIPDDQRYRYTGWIDVPQGQGVTGHAKLWWYWYDFPSCSGTQVLAGSTSIVVGTNGWQAFGTPWEAAPPGTASAWLVLGIYKTDPAPGSFQASFDGLVFNGDRIFVDGFESGGAGVWSSTAGLIKVAFVDWFFDGSCSTVASTGGPYGPGVCVQMPGDASSVKFDCASATFDWYWDATCLNLRAVGCAPEVCCTTPFSATIGSLVWSCP